MHIVRGAPFREEINLIDTQGRPVFSDSARFFLYLEHGLDVQKVELPFDGRKAVFELAPSSTIAIPYERLFYKIAAEVNGKELLLQSGIISIGE